MNNCVCACHKATTLWITTSNHTYDLFAAVLDLRKRRLHSLSGSSAELRFRALRARSANPVLRRRLYSRYSLMHLRPSYFPDLCRSYIRSPFAARMISMRSFKETHLTRRNSSWTFWRDYWNELRSARIAPYEASGSTCVRSLNLLKHARLRVRRVRRPLLALRLGNTRDARASKAQRMSHAYHANCRSIYSRCSRYSGYDRARHATSAVDHGSQYLDRCARERPRHSRFCIFARSGPRCVRAP
ncbi:hypothetical protein ABIB87_006853 [Bradyrhizobium sp. JR18.2]